jgi:hypothetical protein
MPPINDVPIENRGIKPPPTISGMSRSGVFTQASTVFHVFPASMCFHSGTKLCNNDILCRFNSTLHVSRHAGCVVRDLNTVSQPARRISPPARNAGRKSVAWRSNR